MAIITVSGGVGLTMAGTMVAGATKSYAAAVLGDSPIAYWRCGESAGPTLADSSGNGFTATENGDPMMYGEPSLISAPDAVTAVEGNGVAADHWTFGTNATLEPTVAVTMEAWFFPDTTNDAIIQYGSASASDFSGYKLFYGFGSNRFRWYVGTSDGPNNNANNAAYIETPASFPPGSTYHVVATYTSGSMIVYVNGTSVATGTKTGTIKYTDVSSTAPTGVIGNEIFNGVVQGATALDGTIGEVAIYDTVLSPGRVSVHYDLGTL